MNESRPLWGAVLPAAPEKYDQQWMARLTDIVRKVVEQLNEPSQLTAATVVLTDLPQESPRFDREGEVYTKMCDACGPGQVLLAINQTIPEALQHAQRRRLRARGSATGNLGDAGGGAPEGGEAANGNGGS